MCRQMYENQWRGDISRCFKQILIDGDSGMFVLSMWFDDIFKDHPIPIVLKSKTYVFGISQSSAALWICQQHYISDSCKTEEARTVVRDQSFVDDSLDSGPDANKLKATIADYKQAHEDNGFTIKKIQGNITLFPEHHDTVDLLEDDSFGLLIDFARML